MAKKQNIPHVSETPQTSSFVPIIGNTQKEKTLSKYEIEFNKKIKRIEALKQELNKIKEQLDYTRTRLISEIMPLYEQVRVKQRKYIVILDAAYESGNFKKKEAETLMEHILELCEHVMIKQEFTEEEITEEDQQIQQIKEKYEALLFTEEERELMENTTKEMMSNLFGIDLDELRKNPDDYLEKKAKQHKQEEEQREASFRKTQANKKKTKKQIQEEQKLEEEKKMLSKDIRTIYTTLAKELHPDLEQNEQERQRKTEMMKRVTAAYESNDLFELLRLQIEYNIEHERIDSLVEAQIKRYNQLLQEQITALTNQRLELIGWDTPMANIYSKYCKSTLQGTDKVFKQEKAELKLIIDSLQDSINTHTDYKVLKTFLKDLQKEYKRREKEFSFDSFMNW
ncbi:MAG: hypothetical protein MUE81_19430 [Thermoflexibacter sp.]|jgi:hypothetical protein|nr:hypothetical protein [Thermoflexibacter sp.]